MCSKQSKKWKKKCKKLKCGACPECASLFEQVQDVDDVGDDDAAAEDDDDDAGLKLCTKSEAAPSFLQMGDSCQADYIAAMDTSTPLAEDRRCECLRKVDLATAAELDCYSMKGKEATIFEEFRQCVGSAQSSPLTVCSATQMEAVMSPMGPACKLLLGDALSNGTPLDNSTRCDCFMQINPTVAKSVRCKTNSLQEFTLGEEYAQCIAAAPTSISNPPVCTAEDLVPPFAQMDDECGALLRDAIAADTPTTQEKRCACYEQVDDDVGLALACMTMPAKKMTLAQEYQLCVAESMSTLCSEDALFGTAGLAAMSSDCKATLKAALANPDDPLEDEAQCTCYKQVTVIALNKLRHVPELFPPPLPR